MRLRLAGLLAMATMLLIAARASACTVGSGYRIPSNFELVHQADLIVIARVVAGPGRWVELAPIRVLKGVHAGEPLRLDGVLGWRGRPPALPSPTPLRAPHFSVWSGRCDRTLYAEGGLVVAMFARTVHGLVPVGGPFSRAVEDVEGEDGLWVRAVRTYLAAQREAVSAQRGVTATSLREVTTSTLRAAGERLRTRLAGRRGDLAAQAMADDLQTWLDETAPGGPIRRGGAAWRWTSGTDGAGVTLAGAAERPTAALRCAPGERRIRVEVAGIDGAPQLTLAIGAHRFDAEGEARQALFGNAQVVTGTIPYTSRLAALMRRSTATSGIAVNGHILLIATTADVLQKLAIGCETLPRPGSAPARQPIAAKITP